MNPSGPMHAPPRAVFTIGHSNRPLEEFLQLLQSNGVNLVVDVRKMPGSRHNPQYGRDILPPALRRAGIDYAHLPGLGGLRRRRPDSPNRGWRNASFQGYADYMLTPEFEVGLQELLEKASGRKVALMCAEAVPWRCHRSLIADTLVVRSIEVDHILSTARNEPHALRPWAHVQGTRITYPPQADEREEASAPLASAPTSRKKPRPKDS